MKTTIINHKKYTVAPVFNMVLNYEFTDKDNTTYLVDSEDVAEWAEYEDIKWTNNIDMAIKYASFFSEVNDFIFWWTVKKV